MGLLFAYDFLSKSAHLNVLPRIIARSIFGPAFWSRSLPSRSTLACDRQATRYGSGALLLFQWRPCFEFGEDMKPKSGGLWEV